MTVRIRPGLIGSVAVVTAASVTAPALAAADPLITNDLSLVLPEAQNALAVPTPGGRSAREPAAGSRVPAGRRIVDRIVQRAIRGAHTGKGAN